jgi:hypothetical protein
MYKRNTPHTVESLMARTTKRGPCRIWQGATNSTNGYGVSVYKGKQTTVHRIVYLLVHGYLDDNKDVHHTCRNRACINPDHLVLVTHAENMALDRMARDTCRAGHPWNEDNTYLATVKRKQGGTREQRYCRVCRAQHQADLRERRKGINNKGGLHR